MTKKGPSESFLPATVKKGLTELDESNRALRLLHFISPITVYWLTNGSPLKKWSTFFYAMRLLRFLFSIHFI